MVSAGRILILPKGEWDNQTMYSILDLVTYNDVAWLAKRASTGVTPSDSATLYWQKFGSAASIASTSVPGLVMPDGTTITLDAETGAIAVPFATSNAKGLVQPDGTSITINNGVISASGGAIATLSDVTLTNLANGETLVYNSTNQKWQNGSIASALSALSDVTISSAGTNDLLVYDSTASKWKNIKAASTLSLSDTKPIQNKVVTQGLTDALETIGSGASQAYSTGDIILCTDGFWYQASTDIAQNNTLVLNGNVTKTNQRALNTSLTQSITASNAQKFKFDYDSTSGKYGYVVSEGGADTFVPFSENPYSSLIGKVCRFYNGMTDISTITKNTSYSGVTYMAIVFPDKPMTIQSSSTEGRICILRKNGTITFMSSQTASVDLGDVVQIPINYSVTFTW